MKILAGTSLLIVFSFAVVKSQDAAAVTSEVIASCGGVSKKQCPTNFICIYESSDPCGEAQGEGVCKPYGQEVLCSQDYNPVCGCDRKTYSNACTARYQHGINVRSEGECGADNNNNNNNNNKPRDSVLNNLLNEGSVPVGRSCGVGASDNKKKCMPGSFCHIEEGGCSADIPITKGKCELTPLVCNENTLPSMTQVCGCDNKTYRTECHAKREGISIRYRGACFNAQDPTTSTDLSMSCGGRRLLTKKCDGSSYCKFQDGVCGLYDAMGTCTSTPEVCAEFFDQVCGCDGRTYANACKAAQAGVSVRGKGECTLQVVNGATTADPPPTAATTTQLPQEANQEGSLLTEKLLPITLFANVTEGQMCHPSKNINCEDGFYCAYELGTCHTANAMGYCVVQPLACTPSSSSSSPICACDGHMYATECDAAMAGISILSEGSCPRISSSGAASASSLTKAKQVTMTLSMLLAVFATLFML